MPNKTRQAEDTAHNEQAELLRKHRDLCRSLLETVGANGELSRFSDFSLVELRKQAADLLYGS